MKIFIRNYFKLTLLIISIFLLITISIYGGEQEQKYISYSTYHSGTISYIMGGMFTGLMRSEFPDIVFTNEASGGSTENLDNVSRGQTEMSNSSAERLYKAYHAIDEWSEYKDNPVRIFCVDSTQVCLMYTLADSDIKSFYDLKGKQVVTGPPGTSNQIKNSLILEAYGYKRTAEDEYAFDDLKTMFMSNTEAVSALSEGVVDAVISAQPMPDPNFYQLALRKPLRIIPVDEEKFDDVRKLYGWYWAVELPANTYPNQDSPIISLGDSIYKLVNSELVSEQLAYDLIKAYVEKVLPMMSENFEVLKGFVKDPKGLVTGWPIPGHPGVVKYFEEIGLEISYLAPPESE